MTGKHLQFVIPAYKTREDAELTPAKTPSTYLRLGQDATALTSDAAGGDEDLTATDQTFKADTTPWAQRATGNSFYKDDGVSVTSSGSMSTLSSALFTRGGVREHTDGNRISTTRGDSVEVVGGNYKLVVMGRVSGTHVGTSTWESSGGHNHDSTSTPGEVTAITWVGATDDVPNTWQVTETTEKGDVYEEFTGRQESVFSGPSIESETGKKKPSWMGSGDHYKPNITETTHAREITSVTKAKKIDSTETISGNKDETVETKAACSDHFEWTDITSGGKSTSVTKAKTFDERLNAGMVFSFDQFAKKEDNFAGTWTNNLEFGLHVDLSVHTVLNLHYDHVVLNLGLSFEIEKSLGASATVSIAPLINLTMNTVEADPPDINADLLTVVAKVQEQRIKALKQHAAALFTKQAPQWIRS